MYTSAIGLGQTHTWSMLRFWVCQKSYALRRLWYRSKGYDTIRGRGTGEAQMQANNVYGGQDPREMPAYSILVEHFVNSLQAVSA